ncbi:MAG: glycosyltransferase family 39 protein [Actinobacteria bacterium]|nr:glycosyltransferase family 39 protein [Actinomycetota bacterium]
MNKRAAQVAAAAIIVLAVALRWFQLGRLSFYFDELYNVWANKMSLGGMLREQVAAGHPPLFYLVARGWYFFGTSEVWARSLSALAGVLTVLFVYLAARELFSRRAGLWAAAFTAASPLLVWYSRVNSYYSFLIMVTTLSMWLLIRASLRGGWGNWAAYTLAVAAMLFTYFFGIVLVGAGWVFYLLVKRQDKKFSAPWLASQAALICVAGVTFLLSRAAAAESGRLNVPGSGVSGIVSTGWKLFRELAYDLIIAPFVLVAGRLDASINYSGNEGFPLSHVALFLAVVVVGVAAYLTLGWLRELVRTRKMAAAASFVFLMVSGPLALQLINGGALSGRFYVWAAPAFFLLAGAIVAAAPWRVGAVLGVIAVAFMASVSVWVFHGLGNDDADWRSMMGLIAAQSAQGDRIVGFPIHNVYLAEDYYMAQPVPLTGGIPSMVDDSVFFLPDGTTWGGYRSGYWVGSGATPPLSGVALSQKMAAELSGARRLWLVAQNGQLSGQVQRLIDSGWVERGRWDYASFELVLYVPRGETGP